MSEMLTVDVLLALPHKCWRRRIEIAPGTTAADAVRASGLDALCHEQCGQMPKIGVFGRKVGDDHVVQAGERLELYRELTADPRQRRRADVQARRERTRLQQARDDGSGD
ncbi:RnfH family protein [Salinisphaera aquimarina]|uniref:UPF0125 protein ACFOSU_18215 n=1 Tax=Salinisphaera aquimarina TaxID=2094031 RepID=A0ABV7EUZ7_9GAMM